MAVDPIRTRRVNEAPLRTERPFILYWMTAYRRPRYNLALERAVDVALELGKPLVVLEALRSDYRWASDRMQRFVADGMHHNARAFAARGVAYHPYLERRSGESKTLLRDFASGACAVITDDSPAFFLPRMIAAAGRSLDVRLEAVDSNGLLPMRAARRVFERAVDFRRFLQGALGPHLLRMPRADPLARSGLKTGLEVPLDLSERWPAADDALLAGHRGFEEFQIDHAVPPIRERGGPGAAAARWRDFLERRLHRYGDDRNDPDDETSSGLSSYLHWGHVSAHELFVDLSHREGWRPELLGGRADGKRSGWWGMSSAVEGFLDELVTWRELGFNMAWQRDDYDRYESLPEWSRATLEAHQADPRPHLYGLEALRSARTHDEVWNAAQRQLVRDGRIHSYLRMLWGKKILEWSPTPRDALDVMIELNNRYAVDGRDPNSTSGIFWILGRYDRAWGPERPIFGKVRYMTSDSTRKKLRLRKYLREHSGQSPLFTADE